MIGHVVTSITVAQVIGWMASWWLWSGCQVGNRTYVFLDFLFWHLLFKCSRKTQKLQFALQRVLVFPPINLCNALFIAFLCNYSVIRLSPVLFFIVNTVFHCVLPLIGQVFSTLVRLCLRLQTNLYKDFQKCCPSKARLGLQSKGGIYWRIYFSLASVMAPDSSVFFLVVHDFGPD